MRYSIEPKHRKYVQGYDFLSFVRRFRDLKGAKNRDRKNRSLLFKNNASFIICISKIKSVLIKNTEDLDVVVPMHNLLKYSKDIRFFVELSQRLIKR